MNRLLLLLFICFLWLPACRQSQPENPPPQHGEILLNPEERLGVLFHAVQQSDIFPDSKTFVDCVTKGGDQAVMAAYQAEKDQEGFDLKAFVETHFELPNVVGSQFVSDTSRSVREHIKALWPVLSRQADVANPNSSLIPLPKDYIVPGGRFREVYYWDSYFTMLGLQADGEIALIEQILDNFAHLTDKVGHIPNGNRTYYLSRSQPPFFSSMVGLLADVQGDSVWAKYHQALKREYAFWMKGQDHLSESQNEYLRLVRLPDGSILNRYRDDQDTPRPEGYKEDIETAEGAADPAQVYRDLRSAAESGWDFSSRWFRDEQNLSTIHTTEIIPVDLNCLLNHLERSIAHGYMLAGDEAQGQVYMDKANARKAALLKYCWNAEKGYFHDYDFVAQQHTPVQTIAGMFPFYYKLASQEQAEAAAKVIEAGFLQAGGVLSTLNHTGQQWDAPNGWAPLQWVTIQGLAHYGQNELSETIRDRWLALNEKIYRNTGKLVEKYNVVDMNLEDGGGEYPVVEGFGWTNGVYAKLMEMKK